MVDSGKQMDLNGDGIIEMGEENYYETDPNKYTYFVDVFMVVDEEYKLFMWKPWNTDRWKDISTGAINRASEYFLSTYQVKLNISQIDDSWDSADNKLFSVDLLREAIKVTNWIGSGNGTNNHNSDILVAFTGQDPYLNPLIFNRSYGVAFPASAATITKIPPPHGAMESLETDDLVQHEISHLFRAPDHNDSRYCIMDKTWPSWDKPGDVFGNIWTTHEWDQDCYDIIEKNKHEVSLFREGGDYDITK